MGDAAYERAATAEEIDRMCRLVSEALDAGAAGFSTSFSFAHRGIDGKPVPSRFAARDEVEALFMAAGKAGKGVVLATPGEQCNYPDFYELAARIGRPLTWPLFAAPGGAHRTQLKIHEEKTARGAQRLAAGHAAAAHHAVHAGRRVQPQRGRGVRRAVEGESRGAHGRVSRSGLARACGRRPGRACRCGRAGRPSRCPSRRRFPELQGRRVAELAQERGCSPLDVMCEIAVAEDLETRFRAYIANDDVDAVR